MGARRDRRSSPGGAKETFSVRLLPPLRGWKTGSTISHGLRRGLLSVAPVLQKARAVSCGDATPLFGTPTEDLPRLKIVSCRLALRLLSFAAFARAAAPVWDHTVRVTQTCRLERVALRTTAELAASEILPHRLVLAPRNSGWRSSRAHRDVAKGGRPDRCSPRKRTLTPPCQ